ncbi:MAG: glycoside hydrolase family 38 C-terminal domain-containing protein [Armatimonadota bacterium]|nr:glycoside hydrolase family 38 C-terminal domain-containing protein [Armatimonadota bacterium]
MRISRIFLLLIAVALLFPAVSQSDSDPQAFLTKIGSYSSEPIGEWRHTDQNPPAAEQPGFDDSGWKTGKAEFEWGNTKIGWARTRITLPKQLSGFAIDGAKVVLRMSVDDDGEVYVDGKLVQKFHWDEGYATLTEDARPGQTMLVAVKILNTGGPGRVMSAGLQIDNGIVSTARRLSEDYKLSERLLNSNLLPAGPDYRKALAACNQAIDQAAAGRGDAQAFLASLHQAELQLKPFAEAADDYTCHLIGHAHIDMNWLWLWPETVEICQNTFTSVTDFMDQYPDFTYSQSQAAAYLAVQNTKPELFAKMRKYIKEGRWEITGGTWVEGDVNMASGEAIVRQILYAKQYFREAFGKESEICWLPDSFGHPWTVPQIVKKSGLKYYFFMRCGVGKPVFWWQGIDGSRVLALNLPYSSAVADWLPFRTIELANEIGTKDIAHVYGVGDHGGGPTRADIEQTIDLGKRMVKPNIKFSTAGDFFESALRQKKDYPVHNSELNFTFPGCYTTHGDAKLINRRSENGLPTAEAFSAIAGLYGKAYPLEGFRESWRRTCFNQFHDILPGSAIHGSYEYSRHLFDKTEKQMSSALNGALQHIAKKADTRARGIPVVVFNPLSWTRTDLVEIACPFSEKESKFHVVDSKGRAYPAQRIGNSLAFAARDVPSLGYSVYWVRSGATRPVAGATRASSTPDNCVIENEFLRVTVSRRTGAITSIYDKSARREALESEQGGDVLQALTEAPAGMSAWEIGKITDTQSFDKARSVEVLQSGPVVSSVRVDHWFRTSLFAQDIKLVAGSPRLDIRMTADWKEVGNGEKGSTMLKTAFTVNVENGKARFEIPFGSIERKANGDEVPAQKWIDLSNGSYGVSLLNNCKYGHDINGSTMRLTLLRSSYDPDPQPDVGIHDITYSLYPHAGDWRKAGTVRRGYELNNPLIALRTTAHRGSLGSSHSFVSIAQPNLIVTAFKKSEDGKNLVLRFYESSGVPTQARVRVSGAKTWGQANLMEIPEEKAKAVGKSGIVLPVGKYEIKTLLLK